MKQIVIYDVVCNACVQSVRPHMVREADPPLHHRQILFSTNQIFHQNVLVSDRTDRQTDGQTDGQTDRRNKYVLGLPCFKKLSSEFNIQDIQGGIRSMFHMLIAEVCDMICSYQK